MKDPPDQPNAPEADDTQSTPAARRLTIRN
jgi:hypothetical protein